MRLIAIRNQPDGEEDILLVTTQQPVVFEGIRLRITQVTPARHAGVEIEQDDYRLSVEIEQVSQ